jgi:hypothetical protein
MLKNIQSLLNCAQIDSFLRKDLSEVFQVRRRSFDGTKAHSPSARKKLEKIESETRVSKRRKKEENSERKN